MAVTHLVHKKNHTSTNKHKHPIIKTFTRLVCSMNYSIMLMDTTGEGMYPIKTKHVYTLHSLIY